MAARRLLIALAAAWALASASAQSTYEARFEVAWRLVAERYWDLARSAVDWTEAGDRFRPLARDAADDDAFYVVLETMYAAIGDDHSVFVPPSRVAAIRERYGDLPCLGVFGAAAHSVPTEERVPPPEGLEWSGPVSFAIVAGDVGYLRVTDLAAHGTAEGVRAAVTLLARRGARSLVLDLRANPGGRLVTMMQVAGVFTRGFLWRTITTWSLPIPYPALGAPVTDAPLAILVDGDVHSAAEGLAGALQGQGRALVVGSTTAGNVEAVMPFCLRDGSQAWIATGVLAPLRGPTWSGTGVVPDLEADDASALTVAVAALRRAR